MSDDSVDLDMKTDFLRATFKGESDFYICSDNWKRKHSYDVCCELNRCKYYLKSSSANQL